MEVPPLSKAFTPGTVILFQGDSITDGGRLRTGMDYNHIMGQDYCYIIAGQIQSQHPEANLNFVNRGESGDKITDLENRWQGDTLDLKPSLLSILIGVNDAVFTPDDGSPVQKGAVYQQKYVALIEQTFTALPDVKIVLAQPFVLPSDPVQGNFSLLKDSVAAMQVASEAVAAQFKLPYVRYAEMFAAACTRAPSTHWCWDGIHPTYAGHYLMHSLWLETVSQFFDASS